MVLVHTTPHNSLWQTESPWTQHAARLMDRPPLNITRRDTHSHPPGCVWWRGRLRREGGGMEQRSQDKGRGEGRYTSARWHRLLCNWAPQLFLHQPPCPPFFLPEPPLLYRSGLRDWRQCLGLWTHRGSASSPCPSYTFCVTTLQSPLTYEL